MRNILGFLQQALACTLLLKILIPLPALAQGAAFSVIYSGKNIGHLIAETKGDLTSVDYDYKDNGRGPTIKEVIRTDAEGLPVEWSIQGTTTFGSKVEEHFSQNDSLAEWVDSTGKNSATIREPGLYVAQAGSPWSGQIFAHALLHAPGMSKPILPKGTLRLEKGEALTLQSGNGPVPVTRYDLTGIELSPTTVLIDDNGNLFAQVSPTFILIRKGYEGEDARLRKLAADWSTERFAKMEKEVAHHYGTPVRIKNVRIFDPKASALTGPVSVLVRGKEIAAVEPLTSPSTPGEVTVDGAGGTLIAGMYEMHAHLNQEGALLNLMAGTTTVRDMGNDNAVLDKLIERMDAGEIGGPHVLRSGFIEGKSPFSATSGILVDSQEKAIDAVRWYGARGYWQIKIYNSMNPAWVPAMTKEAHLLGMRVAGHVPAFSTADR